MPMRWRCACAPLGFLLALTGQFRLTAQDRSIVPAGAPERRLALVVGNNAYREAPLQNGVPDAAAMNEALTRLGFRVILATDAEMQTFERKVDEFIGSLRPGDVALFYFSGHGIQLEGENYLAPVDVRTRDAIEVKYSTYPAAKLLQRMEGSGSRLNIMILDACRNNPFGSARALGQGLAPMSAGAGSYIAFATAPGQTASDNPRGTNGLFTSYLLETLQQPGLTLDQLFGRVRGGVSAASGRRQVPWSMSSVIGDFYFSNAHASVPTIPEPVASEPVSGPYRIRDVRISPDGKTALFTGETARARHLYTVALEGGAPRPITGGPGTYENGRWFADSKRIAFLSSRNGSSELWGSMADGSRPEKLTGVPAGVRGVAVGRTEWDNVVYLALDHLFTFGPGAPLDLTPDRLAMSDYDISPDGTEVCYVSDTGGSNPDLYVVPRTGGASRRITVNPGADRNPAYSPDGKYLAFRAQALPDSNDRWRLLVLDRGTGKILNLTETLNVTVKNFIWLTDSSRLFFVADRERGSDVFHVPVTGGAVRNAVAAPDQRITEIQFTPDGKTLLYVAQEGSEWPKLYRAASSGGKPVVIAP